MDAAVLLDTIRPAWKAAVAPSLGARWFDKFVKEQREQILVLLEQWLLGNLAAETVSGPSLPDLIATARELARREVETAAERGSTPRAEVDRLAEDVDYAIRAIKAAAQNDMDLDTVNWADGVLALAPAARGQVRSAFLNAARAAARRMTGHAAPREATPAMIAALRAIRVDEVERPDQQHAAPPGVSGRTLDALVDHGFIKAFDNRHGGFPHYRTTPKGRALVDVAPRPITHAAAERWIAGVDDQIASLQREGVETAEDREVLAALQQERAEAAATLDIARKATDAPPAETVSRTSATIADDPDEWSKPRRTAANLKAMQIVAAKVPASAPPGARGEETLSPADRRAVLAYSGWGGLSIDDVRDKFPPGFVPETFGLIHEYYTPTVVAQAVADMVCPLVSELKQGRSHVRALEPSAGIGRLARAMDRCPVSLAWTLVEFSQVSSRMLRAVYPDAAHYWMPFERFIAEYSAQLRGSLGLILSNPPYGERGEAALIDQDAAFKERRAYAYFLRRALDLLEPNGIGVFLVPAGALSGTGAEARKLRERLLLRNHLSGAFRLPSHSPDESGKTREFVPGAFVVMDIHIWRSRGGQLAAIDPADVAILEGKYFEEYPEHILGTESGPFTDQGKTGNWRYRIDGEFTGLPQLVERPLCSACAVMQVAPSKPGRKRHDVVLPDASATAEITVPEALASMLQLGARVTVYLQARAADDGARAVALWPELHQALQDLRQVPEVVSSGGVRRHPGLRDAAERGIAGAQQLRNAFTDDGLVVPALNERPVFTPRFQGRPNDIVAQADMLFRQRRHLTIRDLMTYHRGLGGQLDERQALAQLLAASWNRDGDEWDELLPLDAYTSGRTLWDRHDRAQARADAGDDQARLQAERVLAAIKPASFDDLTDLSPVHGYVPLPLLSQWVSETLQGRLGAVELMRSKGLVSIAGTSYEDVDDRGGVSPMTLAFLGFINHDPELFKPPKEKGRRGRMTAEEKKQEKENLAEQRRKQVAAWAESFNAWCAAEPERRDLITEAYNRTARGRVVPKYSAEPLQIARWGAHSPTLKPHQVAGAKRVLENRGGLVAFDVGVGKTYTALAIIARARQEGWVRRPVILVPPSIVWKWYDDIRCTLPDYRVAVIGGNRKRNRKGVLTSEEDTPEQQAQKWLALQAGQLGADPLRRPGPLADVLGELSDDESVESLQPLQRLLYWTAAMVSAPRCLGEVQQASEAGVREAYRLYRSARRRLLGGAPERAIVSALTRVIRGAAQISTDCGEGQVTLFGVPLQLQVDPDDRATLVG